MAATIRVPKTDAHRGLHQARELLRSSIVRAAEVLREVMDDPNADNRDKLRAAELLLKTVTGRADFESKAEASPAWAEVLRRSVCDVKAIEVTSAEG